MLSDRRRASSLRARAAVYPCGERVRRGVRTDVGSSCQPPGMDDDSVGRRMERPRTALRGPPKVQTNTAVRDTRPTSKQDASRGAKVIGEGDAASDDEDDAGGALGGGNIIQHGGRGERAEVTAEGHGALVRNMMNAKADMDTDGRPDSGSAAAASENLVGLNLNKDRQKTQEDMGKLREAIQALCQSSNPLARSMDYLQEVPLALLLVPLALLPMPLLQGYEAQQHEAQQHEAQQRKRAAAAAAAAARAPNR